MEERWAPGPVTGHGDVCYAACEEGEHFIMGFADGRLLLHKAATLERDVASGDGGRVHEDHDGGVRALAVTRSGGDGDGVFFATACEDKRVRLFAYPARSDFPVEVTRYNLQARATRIVAPKPSLAAPGRAAVRQSVPSALRLSLTPELPPAAKVHAVAFSADGTVLASGGEDAHIQCAPKFPNSYLDPCKPRRCLRQHSHRPYALCCRLHSVADDGSVEPKMSISLEKYTTVRSLAFDPKVLKLSKHLHAPASMLCHPRAQLPRKL